MIPHIHLLFEFISIPYKNQHQTFNIKKNWPGPNQVSRVFNYTTATWSTVQTLPPLRSVYIWPEARYKPYLFQDLSTHTVQTLPLPESVYTQYKPYLFQNLSTHGTNPTSSRICLHTLYKPYLFQNLSTHSTNPTSSRICLHMVQTLPLPGSVYTWYKPYLFQDLSTHGTNPTSSRICLHMVQTLPLLGSVYTWYKPYLFQDLSTHGTNPTSSRICLHTAWTCSSLTAPSPLFIFMFSMPGLKNFCKQMIKSHTMLLCLGVKTVSYFQSELSWQLTFVNCCCNLFY